MEKILIVDCCTSFLSKAENILSKTLEVLKAVSGKEAIEILNKNKISVLLINLNISDINGLQLIKKIRNEIDPLIPIIILTDNKDYNTTVEAMHFGIMDFIQKDCNLEFLNSRITSVLQKNKTEIAANFLRNEIYENRDQLIFSSSVMQFVDIEITRNAMHDEHILLFGETGTGKDLIAYNIHKRSRRCKELFLTVPINSLNETLLESELFGHEKGSYTGADISKIGMLEAANKGTIYIPEISELTERIQIKLLDFMQNKNIYHVGSSGKQIKLDVRVIMASNKNLKMQVEQNKFRRDFYYRISPFTIKIPALKERNGDIKLLANYFLQKFSRQYNKRGLIITEELLRELEGLQWKGNIRELSSNLMHAVIYAEDNTILTSEFFPSLNDEESIIKIGVDLPENYKNAEKKFRKDFFQKLLKQTKGNKTKAAEIAGITRQGLNKILKELGLE